MDRRKPNTATVDEALAEALTELVVGAALAVRAEAGAGARLKADGSPVTSADEASEALLLAGLSRLLPGVPVVSEEQAGIGPPPCCAGDFVLVDPLDGTREFVAGLPEYTVNLALIHAGTPVFGVVAAPALGQLWRGCVGARAERVALDGESSPTPIAVRPWPERDPVAVVSRSHLDRRTTALLAAVPGLRSEPCGSSLKFCRLAEGRADFYPRLAPTSEWDIAAGHAVLAAAGGAVTRADGGAIAYGQAQAGFCVPSFLALADPAALPRFSSRA